MYALKPPRRGFIFAAGLLASVAFACSTSASALAVTHIYGSGAALQTLLQKNILIPNAPAAIGEITYTGTTSGKGAEEFGFSTAKVLLTADPTAEAAGVLDGFVGTDSAASSTELANATTASGAGSSPNLATVPVAQTPLDILLSLPSKIVVLGTQLIQLTNKLLSELFAGTVPTAGVYPANTWGALLTGAGLKATATTPVVGEFEEEGTSAGGTGGYTPISVEVRKNGAGTTLILKQYLFTVDKLGSWTEWKEPPVFLDENAYGTEEWPTGAKILPATGGNSTDANEVEAVDKTPGTVGYATAGDAALNTSVPFKATATLSEDGSSADHFILYALIQNNGVAVSGAEYANPEANEEGKPNVYTGKVLINGAGSGPTNENWLVPSSYTGTWFGTYASDPEIGGTEASAYPIIAVAWDYGWLNYMTTELETQYKSTGLSTGKVTREYLEWVTAAASGQAAISNWGDVGNEDADYYAPLPSNIQPEANAAAKEINEGN